MTHHLGSRGPQVKGVLKEPSWALATPLWRGHYQPVLVVRSGGLFGRPKVSKMGPFGVPNGVHFLMVSNGMPLENYETIEMN